MTTIKRQVREIHTYIPEDVMKRVDKEIEKTGERATSKALTKILEDYCDLQDEKEHTKED